MKKYITLLFLCCFIQTKAAQQDAADISGFMIDMGKLKQDLEKLESELKETLQTTTSNGKQVKDETPTRIEKKSFSGISELEFFHSYGSIIVMESASKQIELEIHYFDTKDQQAICNTKTTGKLLSITTSVSGKNRNRRAKINYIVSIPKNITLNIDLKYGDLKIDTFNAPFQGNLSYSNVSVNKFNSISTILKMKYSDLKIKEANDLNLDAAYSDIRIEKAEKLQIAGNYNDYALGKIGSITSKNSISYGDIKVDILDNLDINAKYTDISINNLLSSMNIVSAYGDIAVKNVSKTLKSMNIKGSYSDIYITIPQDLSVSFEANLTYGDLSISKQYNVNYTESIEKGSRIQKKGTIGSKNPTASIIVTNSYADLKIR